MIQVESGVTRRQNRFFVWIAIAMIAVILAAFSRSFYLRPMYTTEPLPSYLIVHGIVLSAWYVLFLVQAVLASGRRVRLHRRLGVAGVALAAGVVVTGAMVHLNLIPRVQPMGVLDDPAEMSRAVDFVLAGLLSLLPFIVLIGLALLCRRRSDVHNRLIFWAMVWTLGPAFSNTRPLAQLLDPLVEPWLPFFPADLFWIAAILGYDWKTLRRVVRSGS
jgi:hypothetical protein